MNRKRLILNKIIGLILAFNVFTVKAKFLESPHYPYIQYTVDNGLPQSIVSHLEQDSYGFVWIGTADGLTRFDGHSFQVFNGGTGYPFRMICGILERAPGKIWVATIDNGLWELENAVARRITFNDTLYASRINYVTRTHDQEILIGGEPGGFYVVKDDSVILHLSVESGRLPSKTISAAKDFNGYYWIGTYDQGILVYKNEKEKFQLTTKDGLPSNEIRTILALPSGEVWVGTTKGFFIYGNPQLTKKLNTFFPNVFVHSIYSNNQRDIWINLFSEPGGVIHIKDNKILEVLYANQGFYSKVTLISRSGVLFIGSDKGLLVHPSRNFENFGKESGLKDTYIRTITRDLDGHILVATKNAGLYKFVNRHFYPLENINKNITGNSVLDMHIVGNQLWLATLRGLYIVQNDRLIENHITEFFKDKAIRRFSQIDDTLFIVAKTAIFKLQNNEIIDYTFNFKGKRVSFWGLSKDRKNRLIAATNGDGLLYLKNQQWQRLNISDPALQFYSMQLDSQNILYLGTPNKLLRWDGEHCSTLLQLKQTIWDIYPSKYGLWLLTSQGLFYFNHDQVRIYNHSNGFITTEFNMRAIYPVNDNEIWFGGVDGLVHFKKVENFIDFIPKFYITKIQSNDSLFTYPYPSKITLPANNNSLQIQFEKINFGNAPYYEFAYWLEGFNQDTVLLPGEDINFVDYSYLPDGEYTFHLYLINPFTNKIAASRFVSFVILKPWYKSPLFIFSLVVLIIGFIFVIFHARESYLKKRNLILEKQVQERTEDIRQSYKLLKRETEQRKKAQEQLEITLKSIADGVVRTDLKGKILLINESAEKILGISAKDCIGKPLNTTLHLLEENSDTPIRLPEYLNQNNQPEPRNYFYARLNNNHGQEVKHIHVSWSKIREENQTESGYVWVFRDISVEKQLENEILKSQKLESIGLLAGGIAHDFNNILSGILGNAQLAKLNWLNGQDIQKYLEGIEEATLNASHLTKQLLTFAKGGEPVKEILSLKKILKENVEFALRGSNVSCTFDIDENLWSIEADKGQLNQVINNLVINAIQAMPGGGTLRVEARNCTRELIKQLMPESESSYFVQIKISDTGIGIPKENLMKIFDPYFTTKQKGSGLGLATTYAIIKKHGGIIKVNSELGKGTTFTICLPAIPDADIEQKEKDDQLATFSGKRILVMDDEEFIRELMGSFLEMIGIEADFAQEGREAIQKYQQALNNGKPFDAVIMDLTIRGGMGGKDAVQEILKLDPKAKVIVASGYSTDSSLANYLALGFVGRLSKPFTLEELNKVLTEVLKD